MGLRIYIGWIHDSPKLFSPFYFSPICEDQELDMNFHTSCTWCWILLSVFEQCVFFGCWRSSLARVTCFCCYKTVMFTGDFLSWLIELTCRWQATVPVGFYNWLEALVECFLSALSFNRSFFTFLRIRVYVPFNFFFPEAVTVHVWDPY